MTKTEKLIQRLRTMPKDFTYDEARTVCERFGYKEYTKGKTSGSRVIFVRERDGRKILLHKPHPSNYLKKYQIRDLVEHMKENGDLE